MIIKSISGNMTFDDDDLDKENFSISNKNNAYRDALDVNAELVKEFCKFENVCQWIVVVYAHTYCSFQLQVMDYDKATLYLQPNMVQKVYLEKDMEITYRVLTNTEIFVMNYMVVYGQVQFRFMPPLTGDPSSFVSPH